MRAFHQNVGSIDQWLRLSIGFVLLFLAASDVIGTWGYLGVLLLATAGLRYCPLYHALGIRTGHGRAARR